jgi:hypothetical protein
MSGIRSRSINNCSFCRLSGHNIRTCFENKVEVFEMNMQTLCLRSQEHEFKNYLEIQLFSGELDIGFLREYAERKCDFIILSSIITEGNLYDIIDIITNYIYYIYKYQYEELSEENIGEEIVTLLTNFREPVYRERRILESEGQNMAAALENDLSSAILFYDMMMAMNTENISVIEEEKVNHNIDIVLLQETDSNQIKECDICYETYSKNEFIKINCRHELCKNCIKRLIIKNKNKSSCPFCREKICKITVKTQEIRIELL